MRFRLPLLLAVVDDADDDDDDEDDVTPVSPFRLAFEDGNEPPSSAVKSMCSVARDDDDECEYDE
jgi:hypothetical protein